MMIRHHQLHISLVPLATPLSTQGGFRDLAYCSQAMLAKLR